MAVYILNNYDISSSTSDIAILYGFANGNDPVSFGKTIGSIIQKFFNIQVPEAKYGSV